MHKETKKNKMKSSTVHKDIFYYKLPDGGLKTCSYILPNNNIKFDPPVFEQRYTTTARIIQDERWNGGPLKKIVDFGCAEMRLLQFLKRINHVEHILAVDIDRNVLVNNQTKAMPFMWDYLHNREIPLRIEVLCGSIIEYDIHLRDVDVVIGLEIIEHLTLDILEKVPENIFNVIKPKLAIFSTPNVEFNVLFPSLLANGYRHDDHKFEWTRKQFHSWAFNICEMYPNYKVAFLGLGKPPNNRKHLGYATQLAIFARIDILNEEFIYEYQQLQQQLQQLQQQLQQQQEQQSDELLDEKYQKNNYEEIYTVNYPYKPDNRTLEEKIIQETRYLIHQFRYTPKYFNTACNIYQLPLNTLLEFIVNKWESVSQDQYLSIVQKMDDVQIENDFIILPEYDDDDDDDDDDDYDDCGNNYDAYDEAVEPCNSVPTNDDSEEDWN